MSRVRRATHAGSWYSDEAGLLNQELSGWLDKAPQNGGAARAIIAPHAGYYYCGSCGAHAYRQVNPSLVRRVFILGPSHHVRLTGCALSEMERYQTPFYDLPIDTEVYNELYACNEQYGTKMFEPMVRSTDEDEHSIEMHLPYIAKVMESKRGQFTIVPVLVGSLTPEREQVYGKVFSRYLADPNNLFVISSDFCHWGQRFRYTHYDKSCGEIWQSIEQLDRMGMNIIEAMDPVGFSDYLKKFQNTICGRHPIGVLLNAIHHLRHSASNGHTFGLKFLKYNQSSQCKNKQDSSVSYASASLTIQ